jgi:pimeloyl-ACP methyl ester carboxylesterase
MAEQSNTRPVKPTVVIVPGSFSPSSLYSTIISQLSSHGYPALAVSLPSVGRHHGAAPATLAEDAAHIHSVTARLADDGKDIVLAMHSYGGIPGTESARGLAKADRQAKGEKGGITRLVYLTSYLVEEGQSLRDVSGATPESVPMEDGYMIIDEQLKALYAPFVYSDLPVEKGLEWMEKMVDHSSASFDGKLTYPAYKYIPVTYLICEDDKVIAPELQRKMVETVVKSAQVDVDMVSCTAGHGINISMPETVVKVIRTAAGESI